MPLGFVHESRHNIGIRRVCNHQAGSPRKLSTSLELYHLPISPFRRSIAYPSPQSFKRRRSKRHRINKVPPNKPLIIWAPPKQANAQYHQLRPVRRMVLSI